jgi:predicted GNAT family acetyltransferase
MAGPGHPVKRAGTGGCILQRMPSFVVECHPDVLSFLAAAGDWLGAREAAHNLPLGILGGLRDDPNLYGPDAPYLATVRRARDDALIATAIRTPPWRLVLSEVDDPRALSVLADRLAQDAPALPGVVGPSEHVRVLAPDLGDRLGRRATLVVSERAFQLTRVIPPAGAPGHPRLAVPSDRSLVLAWLDAFEREALGAARTSVPAEDAIAMVAAQQARVDRSLARLGERRIWLWDDDGPVALAGVGGPTPSGIRVGPVYTPPESRRRGYASALVAAASQAALDSGRRSVYLFTDRSNRTSNHIYQAIGYGPVRDLDEWSLSPLEAGS